jgi:hypothetical protein
MDDKIDSLSRHAASTRHFFGDFSMDGEGLSFCLIDQTTLNALQRARKVLKGILLVIHDGSVPVFTIPIGFHHLYNESNEHSAWAAEGRIAVSA